MRREMCIDNRIIDAQSSSGDRSWIRVEVGHELVASIINTLLDDSRKSISDIKISWEDHDGMSIPTVIGLRQVLTNDIMDRYYNDEYIDPEATPGNELEDILSRYDNAEYWDPSIVEDFMEESREITLSDIFLAIEIIPKETVEELLSYNRNIGTKIECNIDRGDDND